MKRLLCKLFRRHRLVYKGLGFRDKSFSGTHYLLECERCGQLFHMSLSTKVSKPIEIRNRDTGEIIGYYTPHVFENTLKEVKA